MNGKYYAAHIFRKNIYILAILKSEVSPMMVLEFLNQICETIKNYFSDFNEVILKENFVSIYQLLEEMIDNGEPLITEPSLLKDIIPPPTILSKVMSSVQIPTNLLTGKPNTLVPSKIPWRKEGIRYSGNEIFVDLLEELFITLESNDRLSNGYIKGKIMCDSKLSGMPEIRMIFRNGRVLEDHSTYFHPCVRYSKFLKDRVLSFIPPDGKFKLMDYCVEINNQQSLPIYVKPQFHIRDGEGKLDISVTVRKTGGKDVEDLALTIEFPNGVQNVKINSNSGTNRFDQTCKKLVWKIGSVDGGTSSKIHLLTSTFTNPNNVDLNEYEKFIKVNFKLNMFSMSGLKIDSLTIAENYGTYKGFRSVTKAAQYLIRL